MSRGIEVFANIWKKIRQKLVWSFRQKSALFSAVSYQETCAETSSETILGHGNHIDAFAPLQKISAKTALFSDNF